MKRVRVIPALLIQKGGLVKSIKFKDHRYVGDPINAIRIFNEKGVDEIVVLDISATSEKRGPNMKQIRELASEAFMPMGYGGGITTLDQIKELIQSGIEKVVLNTSAIERSELISTGARYVGSQSIVVSIDVKKSFFGKYHVAIRNGTKNTGLDPVAFARRSEELGAGEILLNSIDQDGTFGGFDKELIRNVSAAVSLPVIAIGGASSIPDFAAAIESGASAVAAGSMFVFQGPHQAILISYPNQQELKEKLFSYLNQSNGLFEG